MKECIILVGGLGTRLQSVVKNVPKCMAEVAGKPFLQYVFNYLERQGFDAITLALGYKANIILDWIGTQKQSFSISYVIEEEPLGTGGAIQHAFSKVRSDQAFVMNGDTFFDIDTTKLQNLHKETESDISIALKPMTNFDRYGSVELSVNQFVIGFNEKRFCKEGLINGGIYLINKDVFSKLELPNKFSFEKEVLESKLDILTISGDIQDRYFIDIGIPSDFEKANRDFIKMF